MRALAILLLFSSALLAQTGASLEFRPVSGAVSFSVVLWPDGDTRCSDDNRRVRFDELPEGDYHGEVLADGFVPLDTALHLAAGEMREIVFALKPITMLPDVVIHSSLETRSLFTFEREQISQSAAATVAEFLEQEAGLDVRSDGVAGALKTVRVGGSNVNQVVVLVDGRRIQDYGSGTADLSAIPLDWIESIEVYRGGQLASSGEAIGGIVQITTREPETDELTTRTVWRETQQQLSVTRGASIGSVSGLFSYSRLQGSGDYRYTISEDDGTGEFTPNLGQTYRRQNADVQRDQMLIKLSQTYEHNLNLSLTGTLDRADRGMPGYLAPYLTPLARQETSQSGLNAKLEQQGSVHHAEFRVAYQQAWKEFTNPDPLALLKHSEEASREWEAETRMSRKWRGAILSGGGLAAKELLRGDHLINEEAARARWAGWGEWRQRLLEHDRFSISSDGGARIEGFGDDRAILPRLSVSTEYSSSWTLGGTVGWGQSYRAPDFYALFWQADQAAQGNPDLEAERSTEWTGSAFIESPWKNHTRLDVNGSVQTIKDLIYWRRTFENQWKPFNLKQADVSTLDVSVTQSAWNESIRFQVGAYWTEARDATDDRITGGKYLTFRPLNSQRANISLDQHNSRLSVTYRRVSKRAVLETNSKWLNAYEIVDAQIAYRFQIHRVGLEPAIGVENLFNENYRIIRFAPMPGREWYLSLKIAVL